MIGYNTKEQAVARMNEMNTTEILGKKVVLTGSSAPYSVLFVPEAYASAHGVDVGGWFVIGKASKKMWGAV